MKKKLLFLMTLALMGWSNVWGTNPEWRIWSEYKNGETVFKETATENVFVAEGVILRWNDTFSIYDNPWSVTYYCGENLTSVNTPTDLSNSGGNSTFKGNNHAYNITLDLRGDSETKKITINYCNVEISETDNSSLIAGAYDPWVNRSLTKDTWQTLCLPFAVTADDITYKFGDQAIVAELTGVSGNALEFTSVTAMEANKPYLVKPSSSDGSFSPSLSFEAKDVVDFLPTPVVQGDYEFIGTNAQKYLAVGTYYVAGGNIHLVITENKTNIKATRAYFRTKDSGLAREMRFVIDGVVTSINQIEIPEEENVTGDIYNLNGQRMDKPFESLPAGVYIVNGKKLIKK